MRVIFLIDMQSFYASINAVSEQADLSKKDASKAVDAVFESITSTLAVKGRKSLPLTLISTVLRKL